MKKIEFGYSNDANPTGSHEGIGIKPGLFLWVADYYGSVEFEGDYYVVAKVVDGKSNNCPKLLDNFIVRQALCDLFADGSTILMLNQEESEITKMLENRLNNSQIKNEISTIEDIISLVPGLHRSSDAFILAELGYNGRIVSTSILPEAFERKNSAIKSCHRPISSLQEALNMDLGYRR